MPRGFSTSSGKRPLRIVHAACFGLKPKRNYYLNTAGKLSNGWVRAGHHVIDFSVRDVARWAGFGSRELGAMAARKALRDLCRAMRPDVLALGHAEAVLPQTVAEIRDAVPTLKVLQWNIDWILAPGQPDRLEDSASRNVERILRKADVVDASFVSNAGAALDYLGTRMKQVAFLPNPVDPAIETGRGFERADQPHDVFFADGSSAGLRIHAGRERHMGAMIEDLGRRLPGLVIDAHGVNGRPPIIGPAYAAAIQAARIGLNISRCNDFYLYSSDRLAHLAGNGLAVCIDRATGYGDLFSEDEFVFYATEDELIAQLDRLGRDDALRRRIAARGYRRYSALFDAATVAQYMLDVVFDAHDPARYEWPTVAGSARAAVRTTARTEAPAGMAGAERFT